MGTDFWASVKKTVGAIAPVLGNAIMPGVGGAAASAIASLLGCNNDPESINTAVTNATPDQIIALKKMEFDHQDKWLELSIESDKIYLQDVQNARQREVTIVQATGKKDINLYILSWTIIVGCGLIVGLLLCKAVPEGQQNVLYMAIGSILTGFTTVVQYFFGSSKGSADKTTLLAGAGSKGKE